LDSKNDISVFGLETGKLIASYAPPGHVMALVSDPCLDYCLIGLQNGGYELDKH
jgi:syntaxin-binding protein 5